MYIIIWAGSKIKLYYVHAHLPRKLASIMLFRVATATLLLASGSVALQPPVQRAAPSSSGRPALRLPKQSLEWAAAKSALVAPLLAVPPPALAADTGYAQTSYYTTLALYVLAFPGVYSLVKRSVKSKMVRKTYEVAGPAADGGRPTRELAGDIVAFFQANNYKIKDAADVIVFEGTSAPLKGRAAFLTFCVFFALGNPDPKPCPHH